MLKLTSRYNDRELTKLCRECGIYGARMTFRVRMESETKESLWRKSRGRFGGWVTTKNGLCIRVFSHRSGINIPEDVRKSVNLEDSIRRTRVYLNRDILIPAMSVRFVNPSLDLKAYLKIAGLEDLVWFRKPPKANYLRVGYSLFNVKSVADVAAAATTEMSS